MSILIKDMGMPKEKKITLTIFPDGRVYENHGERLWGHGEDCIPWKAIPVPPHGALMDRDDFFATCPELIDGYKRITDDLVVIPAEEGET